MLKFHKISFRLPALLLSHCGIFRKHGHDLYLKIHCQIKKKNSSTFFSMNEVESRAIEVMLITCSSAVLAPPKFTTLEPQSLAPGDEAP